MKYSDKLLDPKWQRKRLEILNRENFTCELCRATDKTLHVHHKTYVYGKDPWEYTNANFQVLCADCHESEEQIKEDLKGLIHDLLLMNFSYIDIYIHLKKLI